MPCAPRPRPSKAVLNYSPYDKRCLGEGAVAADLWACQEASVKTHRPLLKGLYAGHVARWNRVFGSSQVLLPVPRDAGIVSHRKNARSPGGLIFEWLV